MSWSDRVRTGGAPLGIASALIVVAIASVEARLSEDWGAGAYLVVNLIPAAVLLGAGLVASRGRGRPDGVATALLVSGLALAAGASAALAALLGDGDAAWIGIVAVAFAGLAACVAKWSGSPVVALIAALGLSVAAVAGLVAIADPEGPDAFRGLATGLAVCFAALAMTVKDKGVSVQMVNAAGLSLLVLGWSLAGLTPLGFGQAPLGWQAVLFVGGLGSVSYAIARREPGPGYLGAITLLFFASGMVGDEPDASLTGWPLVLIGLAVVATAYALLRPRDVALGAKQADPPAAG